MNYPLAKCDTCVAFMEAIGNLLCADGVCGIVSQNSWMYLKSFSEAREKYVSEYYFRYIANLGSGAFIDLSGEKSNVSLIVFEKKNQKRVRLLKGEKFMYFIIILLLCLIPMLNVYTSSLVTKTNIDVEKLKKEISSQEEENESLSMQIDELASIDNIFNVAKEYGLSYNNSSILQVK